MNIALKFMVNLKFGKIILLLDVKYLVVMLVGKRFVFSATFRTNRSNFKQVLGYWENKENVYEFLDKIKQKYNLETPDDWNSITQKQIRLHGGGTLLGKYSMYELKCMGCPDGKLIYKNPKQSAGFWENKDNVLHFLDKIKKKYNLKSPDGWNSITTKEIQSNGGCTVLKYYSIYQLKCMACPEGKLKFENIKRTSKYTKIKEKILEGLLEMKQKYNLETPDDWNSITRKQIQSIIDDSLLKKFSLFELKCMACPEGKSMFKNSKQSSGYWENKENVYEFLDKIKQKYNLETTDDWNSITQKQIKDHGGASLLAKYSMFELKCMAHSDGKLIFDNPKQSSGYWENKDNVFNFLFELKQKYNLESPEDWDSITRKQIQSNGGGSLLTLYSMFELKCLACPEGKSHFKSKQSSGYWENSENVLNFLFRLEKIYNLNTPEDWNSITQQHIKDNGGSMLLKKYSMFELKSLACPTGTSGFNKPKEVKEPGYWQDETNINNFFEELKFKYHLKTLLDWKRISKSQIISQGGNWLFNRNNENLKVKIQFENSNKENITKFIPFNELISDSLRKRSSQRWLFLQIQKLFPDEEIVEDYFHSELSRLSGANVQFDVFMIQRNIAIEYHGKHHYEDIPSGFCNLETYKHRDIEKEKLCNQYGIQLIVIPYWWDNTLDSLRTTLNTEMRL